MIPGEKCHRPHLSRGQIFRVAFIWVDAAEQSSVPGSPNSSFLSG
jgi:hypothetical protein